MPLNVTVLDPKGRRHVVNTGLNTSLHQVLEDVCNKLNFSTSDYDLMHLNKKVDLSSTIRFSNLSNNAKLELVKRPESSTKTSAKDEKVTICFSVSNGERFTQHCDPQQTLWEAVAGLPQTEPPDASVVPVCVYTRREIVGEENLKKTTFKSLGIIDGSALIRFFLRPADQPNVQPHVEAIHIPRENSYEWDEPVEQSNSGSYGSHWGAEMDDKPSQLDVINKSMLDVPVKLVLFDDQYSSWKNVETKGKSEISWETNLDEAVTSSDPKESSSHSRDENIVQAISEEKSEMTWEEMDSTDTKESEDEEIISAILEEKSDMTWEPISKGIKAATNTEKPELQAQEEKIVYLDDQNSVLFSLDDAHTRFEDTLPDEFFEVTIADVRYLLADQKRQLREIEETPLQTRAIREADYFTRLKKYPKAIIRINFPDRMVLQGIFKAHNTVKDVEDFVRKFLDDKQMAFYLYLTPPKRILRSEEVLYEVPLVPTAIVHFGCNDVKDHYLEAEVLAKRSSFSGAIRSSSQIRGVAIEPLASVKEDEMTEAKEEDKIDPEPSTNERRQRAVHESKGAVPKWFSSGKK